MTAWDKQRVGTWRLSQFVDPGHNGSCQDIGEFDTFRAATEAARRIAKISKLKGDFTTSFKRGESEPGNIFANGYSRAVSLEPPKEYDPHVELRLSDGRTVWLEDVDAAIREYLDRPVPPTTKELVAALKRHGFLASEAACGPTEITVDAGYGLLFLARDFNRTDGGWEAVVMFDPENGDQYALPDGPLGTASTVEVANWVGTLNRAAVAARKEAAR